MSDPYRPAYYPPPPTTTAQYNPQDYTNDQYGQLTTHHRHSTTNSSYYPQSQTQLTQTSRPSRDSRDRDSDYLDPDRSGHRHKSRHSRHSSDESRDKSRARSKSRVKELGATAAGGAAGALVGHKIGHGNIGTLAGLAVGALGARYVEQQYEKHEDRKRMEDPFEDEGRRGGGRGEMKRRKSFVEQAKDKVSGFLDVGDGKDKRRSHSHVGTSRGARYSDSDSDDSYDDRRDRKGSRSDRSDRYGGSGRSRRDDY